MFKKKIGNKIKVFKTFKEKLNTYVSTNIFNILTNCSSSYSNRLPMVMLQMLFDTALWITVC